MVEWQHQHVDARTKSVTYTGNVRAIYGQEVLTCNVLTLVIEEGHKHGIADGDVHLVDPDGDLSASRLYFDWVSRSGSAENVTVMGATVMVHAKEAVVEPKLWTLTDIDATPCAGERRPLFSVSARKALVLENGEVLIDHPTFSLLGRRLITLRQYRYLSTRRGTGQPLPSIAYSKTNGLSGGWQPGMLVNDQTAINGGLSLGQHEKPSESLQVTHSTLGSEPLFLPRSDFEERFNFSYFGNAYISTPEIERAYVGTRRQSWSLSTSWNQVPVARLDSNAFDKPVELTFEAAKQTRGAGLYGEVRAQRLEEIGGPSQNRVEGLGSLMLPPYVLAPRLYTDIRFDGSAYGGGGNNFGWVHAQLGLVARPNRAFRIGLAYEGGAQFGDATFSDDRLYKTQSLDARFDWLLGPTNFSFLEKYDPRKRSIWDWEVEVSQVSGCVVPYLVYRNFPRGVALGLKLRLDTLVDAIRRRRGQAPQKDVEAFANK